MAMDDVSMEFRGGEESRKFNVAIIENYRLSHSPRPEEVLCCVIHLISGLAISSAFASGWSTVVGTYRVGSMVSDSSRLWYIRMELCDWNIQG